MSKHRGRKRKPGARNAPTPGQPYGRPQRTGNTALPLSPLPPDEVRARRLALFGDEKAPGFCTEAPLDVLLGRHLITEAEHWAGWSFAIMAWVAAGRPFARSQLARFHSTPAPVAWSPLLDDDDSIDAAIDKAERKLQARYGAAIAMLAQGEPGGVQQAVMDVCVYQVVRDGYSLAQLVRGLNALVRHFERSGKAPPRRAND